MSDVNLQNNAGYTAVMLASLTAPDGPGGMEVVRKIMELGNINIRSSQVVQTPAEITQMEFDSQQQQSNALSEGHSTDLIHEYQFSGDNEYRTVV